MNANWDRGVGRHFTAVNEWLARCTEGFLAGIACWLKVDQPSQTVLQICLVNMCNLCIVKGKCSPVRASDIRPTAETTRGSFDYIIGNNWRLIICNPARSWQSNCTCFGQSVLRYYFAGNHITSVEREMKWSLESYCRFVCSIDQWRTLDKCGRLLFRLTKWSFLSGCKYAAIERTVPYQLLSAKTL